MKHLNKENENKTIVNFVSSGERKFNNLEKRNKNNVIC